MRATFISYPTGDVASKIDGIKSFREATGLFLKESKDAVEGLIRGETITIEVVKPEAVEVFRKFGGVVIYTRREVINSLIELAKKALESEEFELCTDLVDVIKKHTAR